MGTRRVVTWLADNWRTVLDLARSHLYLAGVPLSSGSSSRAARVGREPLVALYPAIITTTGLLYTIPSLALFVIMPIVLGTKILDPVNVVVAMTIYTVALLVRTVADGLARCPTTSSRQRRRWATAGSRRLFGVELPLAVPVIAAGLRVAAVQRQHRLRRLARSASPSSVTSSSTATTGSSWASS